MSDSKSDATSDVRELYQKVVLEHHHRPRNAGTLRAPSHRAELHNPLCGDRTLVTLRLDDGVVREVRCQVLGCAICRASGSMMTEAIAGGTTSQALELSRRFLELVGVTRGASSPRPRVPAGGVGDASSEGAESAADDSSTRDDRLGPLAVFGEVKRYPSRGRCATLPWEALQKALEPTAPLA